MSFVMNQMNHFLSAIYLNNLLTVYIIFPEQILLSGQILYNSGRATDQII